MPKKIMTLDEIAGVADRWLSGDVRDCVLSLVEHVRALTPAPQVAEAHCPSRSRGCECPDAGCIANVGAIGWRCELPGEHGQHGALADATSHCRVAWTDADPVARPAPVVEPPAVGLLPCPFCGSADLDRGGNFIRCNGCEAEGPWRSGNQFAAAWNRRAPIPSEPEAPAPVSPRAEASEKDIEIAGEAVSSCLDHPGCGDCHARVARALASAREEGSAAGFERGRRKGLEEACESIRGTAAHWRKRAEHYLTKEPDAWAAAGCDARATALEGAENNVRSLIGDKP